MADRDWKISFNMFQLNNGYFQGRTVNLPEGIVDLLIYLLKVVMFNCFQYVYQRGSREISIGFPKDQISYPIISPDYLQLKKSLAGESPLNHYVIYHMAIDLNSFIRKRPFFANMFFSPVMDL